MKERMSTQTVQSKYYWMFDLCNLMGWVYRCSFSVLTSPVLSPSFLPFHSRHQPPPLPITTRHSHSFCPRLLPLLLFITLTTVQKYPFTPAPPQPDPFLSATSSLVLNKTTLYTLVVTPFSSRSVALVSCCYCCCYCCCSLSVWSDEQQLQHTNTIHTQSQHE